MGGEPEAISRVFFKFAIINKKGNSFINGLGGDAMDDSFLVQQLMDRSGDERTTLPVVFLGNPEKHLKVIFRYI